MKCPFCDKTVQSLPTDEKCSPNPISIYGLSKKFQEELILANGILPKVNKIVLRFQNVFGPGQPLQNPYTGILSIFSNRIRNGQGISIFEDGLESRDFVFITDVIRAIWLSIDCNVGDRIYNVGTGTPSCVLNVAKKLVELFESSVPVTVTREFRVGDIRHNFADITAISKELGFVPETSLETGLSLFTKWVEQQPIGNDTLEKALQELRQKNLLS